MLSAQRPGTPQKLAPPCSNKMIVSWSWGLLPSSVREVVSNAIASNATIAQTGCDRLHLPSPLTLAGIVHSLFPFATCELDAFVLRRCFPKSTDRPRPDRGPGRDR